MKNNTVNNPSLGEEIRSKLIDEAYIAICFIALPMIVSLFLVREFHGMFMFTVAVAGILLIFGLMHLFRDQIPTHIRINALIGVFFLIAIDAFMRWGLLGAGPFLLFSGVILVAVHLEEKWVNPFFYSSIIIYAVIGALITTHSLDDMIGLSTSDAFFSSRVWTVDIIAYTLFLSIAVRSILKLKAYMSQFSMDLSEKYDILVEKDKKIRHQAYYDQLTGLPNRLLFGKEVNNAIKECQQTHSSFIIAYLDIDDFKKINNILGHNIGDKTIRSITKRLELTLSDCAVLARMGGDEFAVLARCDNCSESFGKLYDIIRKSFTQTLKAHDAVYHTSVSVGFICYPDHGTTYDDLLRNADTAMYKAKSLGKNQYVVYDSRMKAMMDERIEMEGQLENALETGELFPYYQPKYDAESGGIVGFEALARWHSPKYGTVPPYKFIPILEDTGMIVKAGKQIMKTALWQLKHWHKMGYDDLTMAVNVSAIQFNNSEFTKDLLEILDTVDIPAKYLEVEITESVLISDFENVVRIVSKLRALGISVALDDFGTGYSSLTYLNRLPIDTLKIDRSFIHDLTDNVNDEIMLPAIINLAHNLNLKVVAEGIENKLHEACLRAYDCDVLQGYYYCRPYAADRITNVLIHTNAPMANSLNS